MILPIFAGLVRIPSSSAGGVRRPGRRGWTTFRHVVLPLAFPAVMAGSIFTFSLTLGDYIAPGLIAGGKQFIGNLILANFGEPATCRSRLPNRSCPGDHDRVPADRAAPRRFEAL